MEDPYYIVKSDIEKALNNLSRLYDKFIDLKHAPQSQNNDLADVQSDIKTALRDVQYDIEDIEETVRIVETNPKKFKITSSDVTERKKFIAETKKRLASIKSGVSQSDYKRNYSLNGRQDSKTKSNAPNQKYSKLDAYHDEENEKFIQSNFSDQQKLIERQDEQVEQVATSLGVLKSMSRQIGDELETQNTKLDYLSHEVDSTAAKLDNVMKKIAKVTRLSDDRRQWTAIGVLILIIVILFFLLVLL